MLDVARATSALIVVAGHLRAALLPDYANIASAGYLTKCFYLISGMGHEAVMAFFVMSGYFVGGAVLKAGYQFEWYGYLVARLSRLWVVLIPALVLTAVCDSLLVRINPSVLTLEGGGAWHSLPSNGKIDLSLWTALLNVFFLHTVVAPTYGTNGALWSLANEAWYYLLFPLLFCAFQRRCGTGKRIVLFSVAVLLMFCMPLTMLALFLVWLMGVAVHLLPRFRVGSLTFLFVFLNLCGVLVIARLGWIPDLFYIFSDLVVGLAFAAFCICVHNRPGKSFGVVGRLFVHMSEMSFSLYVIHMPLLILVVAALFPDCKSEVYSGYGVLLYLGILLCLVGAAHLWWWFFERHASVLRAMVLSRRNRIAPEMLAK